MHFLFPIKVKFEFAVSILKLVAMDNFEMSTPALSRRYSASELRGQNYILKHTRVAVCNDAVIINRSQSYIKVIHLVCLRIPCIATGYDRVDTLPRSLTGHVFAMPFMYPVRPFAACL